MCPHATLPVRARLRTDRTRYVDKSPKVGHPSGCDDHCDSHLIATGLSGPPVLASPGSLPARKQGENHWKHSQADEGWEVAQPQGKYEADAEGRGTPLCLAIPPAP